MDMHGARSFKVFQGMKDSPDFHAVVRGFNVPSAQFLSRIGPQEYRAPATRAGVAQARAVGIDCNQCIAHVILIFMVLQVDAIIQALSTIP